MADLGVLNAVTWDSGSSHANFSTFGTADSSGQLDPIWVSDSGTRINNAANATQEAVYAYFSMSDMPSDFVAMDSISVNVGYLASSVDADKLWNGIAVQIQQSAGGTSMCDEVWVAGDGVSTTDIQTVTYTETGATALTNPDTSSNKATWDSAVIAIRYDVTKNKGGGGQGFGVAALEITGTYTSNQVGDFVKHPFELTFGTTDTSATATIPTVDLNHAFILPGATGNVCVAMQDGTAADDGPGEFLITLDLQNSTTVRGQRMPNGTAASRGAIITGEVLEYVGSSWATDGFRVRDQGVSTNTNGSSETVITIDPATAGETVSDSGQYTVHVTGCSDDSQAYLGMYRPYRFDDGGNPEAKFERGGGSTNDTTFGYAIVEWGSNFTVKEEIMTHNSSTSLGDQTHTISTMTDRTKCALFLGGCEMQSPHNAPEAGLVCFWPSSNTNVYTTMDWASWSAGYSITFYTVYHADLVVEHDSSQTGGTLSDHSTTTSRHWEDLNTGVAYDQATAVYAITGQDGRSTHWGRRSGVAQLLGPSTLAFNKNDENDGVTVWAYQTHDWSNIFTVSALPPLLGRRTLVRI